MRTIEAVPMTPLASLTRTWMVRVPRCGEAHGPRRGRRGRALVEAGPVAEVPLVARDAAGSAEAEAEASSTTLAPGSTGLGVAVSLATERGAQLAAAIRSVQLLTRPISRLVGLADEEPPAALLVASRHGTQIAVGLERPRVWARGREDRRGRAPTSSVPVKDWPAVPCPASTSGTVVPFGALSARDRWLMFGWMRLPMLTFTSLDDPRVAHLRDARVADRRQPDLVQAGHRLADHGRAAGVVREVPLRPGGDGEGHDGAPRRRWSPSG